MSFFESKSFYLVTSLVLFSRLSAACLHNEFECDEGSCIEIKYLCDKEVDCPNREDELGCPKCPKGQFLCLSTNKTCILDQYVCDSHPDCKDESDEEYCDHSEAVLLMPTITLIQPIVLHLIYYRKSLFQGI